MTLDQAVIQLSDIGLMVVGLITLQGGLLLALVGFYVGGRVLRA